jgi:hypothetical protein
MSRRISNKVSIGRDNNGSITQTGIGGDVSESAVVAELGTLLDQLRAELHGQELPKQAVIEDSLDDLAEDVRNTTDADPAVARSRWDKVKGLLTGVAQFTDLVAKISTHVHQLFT